MTSPHQRVLGLAGRLVLGVLFVAGATVAAPTGFGLFWFVPYAGVGTLLAIRRPGTSIGWILLAIGWCLAIATMSIDATAEQFVIGGVDPITAALAIASATAGPAGFVLFGLLAIVLPSGRLPEGRWRGVGRAAVAAGFLTLALSAVMPVIAVSMWGNAASVRVPNPAAILPDLPVWEVITPDTAILPVVAFMIGAAVSLVVRFRRARGVERQQLRWITAALALVVLAVLGGFVVAQLIPEAGESGVVWLGAAAAFPCVPLAIGIAVLRYRLYEIDRIISRTIGWVLVSAILGAVFAVVVVGLQAVLQPVTENNTLAVAASTLAVAALFQPLRTRVQRAVDRRFNRSRADADRAAAAFASHVRSEVDLAKLRAALVTTVDDAVRPASAAVWLRAGAEVGG